MIKHRHNCQIQHQQKDQKPIKSSQRAVLWNMIMVQYLFNFEALFHCNFYIIPWLLCKLDSQIGIVLLLAKYESGASCIDRHWLIALPFFVHKSCLHTHL